MENQMARFDVESKIGNGTYGNVYKCFDRKLDKMVAVKKMKQSFIENHGIPGTLLREISILSILDHDNVVRLHDVIYGKEILIVLEFSDMNLFEFIRNRPVESVLSDLEIKVF